MPTCKGCGAEVLWARIAGKPHPLDPEPAEVRPSHIVMNPSTGNGRFISEETIAQVPGWVEKGALVCRSHYASCPDADKFRRGKE